MRGRLADARVRHEGLQRALGSAAYEEMMRRKQEEAARDKAAALVLARLAIPAELNAYAQELTRIGVKLLPPPPPLLPPNATSSK